MPNQITSAGLEVKTRSELVAELTEAFQDIYGADVNLSSDSPDGQMMNIFVQAAMDYQDLLVQVYNMFNPDNAIGAVLDQRVSINGIQRQAGTYTITNVTIVISSALTLNGLDNEDALPFTVSDNAGNKWILENTEAFVGAGTYVRSFRAEKPGAVLTSPNTITVPVSIVIGVTSVNNPTTYTTLGINEEKDAELRARRQKSVSLSSQGYLQGLLAALENINGVTSAFVYENMTGSTDVNGVPSHSIWVIVNGGDPEEIANAIYQKRSAGAGMHGDQSYIITQVDGSSFVVKWDNVEMEDLYIEFDATSLDGENPPDIAAIRDQLEDLFTPGVGERINVNDLATLIQEIDNNCLVTNAGFSTSYAGTYTPALSPTSKNKQLSVSSANITILPMLLSPESTIVDALGTKQFTGFGGHGTMTYSIDTNVSGGSINSSTGVYTAGSTPGTDVIKVADSDSNFATATVLVQ